MSLWSSIKESAARAGTVAVCDECVRSGEVVVTRGQFDDRAICSRCGQAMRSGERANRVKRSGEFPHGCCS